MNSDRVIEAVAAVAERWRDPEYDRRVRAVNKTLRADNRFTEESVAYAVNHAASCLTEENMRRWLERREASGREKVGVVHAGRAPLAGIRHMLAVLLTGHRYVGAPNPASPALLPAWGTDLSSTGAPVDIDWVEDAAQLIGEVDRVIVGPPLDGSETLIERFRTAGLAPDHLLMRTGDVALGVVDGTESLEARGGFAEDMLLHDGPAPHRVGLLWAPRDLNPDPYLEVLPQFREVFPPHASTDGALAMPRAFLEADDQGHAYGTGFLISRGEPVFPSAPAHIRWAEYDDIEEVSRFIHTHEKRLSMVVAERHAAENLDTKLSVVEPGTAHRRPLDWAAHPPDPIDWLVQRLEEAPPPGGQSA